MSLDRHTAARLDAWLTREPDWASGPDDPQECELCGEPIKPTDEAAEMYHPLINTSEPGGPESVICHAQCGLDAGMEIA